MRIYRLFDKAEKFLERIYWLNRIGMAPTSRVSLKAQVIGGTHIQIGHFSKIFPNSVLSCTDAPFSFASSLLANPKGEIIIGEHTSIRPFACLYTYGGSIKIGDYCSLNPFVMLYGHGGVFIGDNVRIATQTVIVASNHSYDRIDIPISRQPIIHKGIRIENDVWIGAGAKILDGVTIGCGSVIAAGAVVTANIPSFSVAAGVPARVIKNRKPD